MSIAELQIEGELLAVCMDLLPRHVKIVGSVSSTPWVTLLVETPLLSSEVRRVRLVVHDDGLKRTVEMIPVETSSVRIPH